MSCFCIIITRFHSCQKDQLWMPHHHQRILSSSMQWQIPPAPAKFFARKILFTITSLWRVRSTTLDAMISGFTCLRRGNTIRCSWYLHSFGVKSCVITTSETTFMYSQARNAKFVNTWMYPGKKYKSFIKLYFPTKMGLISNNELWISYGVGGNHREFYMCLYLL